MKITNEEKAAPNKLRGEKVYGLIVLYHIT